MAETIQARTISQTKPGIRVGTLQWHKVPDLIAILVLSVGALLMMLPFLWMFSTSLRPIQESFKLPPAWFPTEFHFETYTAVFQSSVPIVNFAMNSVKVTFFVTLGQLITCSMAGYAFARLRFPFRNTLFLLLLASLMVPGQVTIIPVFIIMKQLGLIDNHLSIILPFLTSAFGVFLLRQFFLTIPRDYDDAAYIDGCNPLSLFWRIHLPLSLPALGVVNIFQLTFIWNDFINPLIYLHKEPQFTVALGLRLFQGRMSNNMQDLMAASLIAVLPTLIVFFFAQRYFVQGIVVSGVKG